MKSEPTNAEWPFTFENTDSEYISYSWTNSELRRDEGMAQAKASAKGAIEKNRAANGVFEKTQAGGFGLYIAPDPFISKSYGKNLMVVRIKRGIRANMVHPSVVFNGSHQARNFLPAVDSPTPLLHYFWRRSMASVVRDPAVLSSVNVIAVEKAQPLEDLPVIHSLTDENLADALAAYSPWMDVFATDRKSEDSRGALEPEAMTDQDWIAIAEQQNAVKSAKTDSTSQALTSEQIAIVKTPTIEAKITAFHKAALLFRKQKRSQWSKVWNERTPAPLATCKELSPRLEGLQATSSDIVGYLSEGMYTPSIVTFRITPENTAVKKVKVIARNGDAVNIELPDGNTGWTALNDFTCAGE